MSIWGKVTSRIGTIAAFVAASFVLGLVKLPAPVPSVALDSSPGYFLSAYLSPVIGGIVGALGHLASAASAGFPLGHVHIVVAGQMFFWCLVFGMIARAINRHWGLGVAAVVAVVLNGVIGPLMVGALGLVPWTLAKGIIPLLTFAASLNTAVASLAVFLMTSKSARGAEPAGPSDEAEPGTDGERGGIEP